MDREGVPQVMNAGRMSQSVRAADSCVDTQATERIVNQLARWRDPLPI
jgi:hypothetical protein